MPKSIMHYEYLATDRIRNLYQQIRKGWLHRMPLQLSFNLLQLGQVAVSKAGEKEPSTIDQLNVVLAYLEKHQPEKIATVDESDESRWYIRGTLPMFSHGVPQGFGVKDTDTPEFIYYGGATDTVVLGLAGPAANLVSQRPTSGTMANVSSSIPHLTRVLARQYQMQSRFLEQGRAARSRIKYDEGQALDCIEYMEQYNRAGMHMRVYTFFATFKLDRPASESFEKKRIILASPIFMAYAD